MGKLRLEKNNFEVSCDIPFCNARSNFMVVGNGPLNMGFNLCGECSKELYEELKSHYEPKVEEVVEAVEEIVEKVEPKKKKKGANK